MPVKSEKQRRFMYASLAGKTDVPPSVAKKFVGPKAHAEGGEMKESKAMMKKEVSFMEAKKAPKKMIAHEKKEMKGYAKGGFATVPGGKLPASSQWKNGAKGSSTASGLDKGNKSADGIAQRGKTRGDNIVMKKRGGKC